MVALPAQRDTATPATPLWVSLVIWCCVPAGSRVREGGFSLLGDRQTQVGAGDGPEIQVKVYGLVSDVKVTDQSG
jgi:hypothetical protein